MKRTYIRRILKWLLSGALLLAVAVTFADWHVTASMNAYCSADIAELPDTRVAIVLGTSHQLSSGKTNLYFTHRIDAAVRLYETKKIERILVSGDNRSVYYNEPERMREALIERGIPKKIIHMDFAGLRTLDSMIRSKKVFEQDSLLVVSQAFHNHRAVYIARKRGIAAWGYNAKDVDINSGLRTRIRESLARTKMLLDLYVFKTEPRHLGDVVEIPE